MMPTASPATSMQTARADSRAPRAAVDQREIIPRATRAACDRRRRARPGDIACPAPQRRSTGWTRSHRRESVRPTGILEACRRDHECAQTGGADGVPGERTPGQRGAEPRRCRSSGSAASAGAAQEVRARARRSAWRTSRSAPETAGRGARRGSGRQRRESGPGAEGQRRRECGEKRKDEQPRRPVPRTGAVGRKQPGEQRGGAEQIRNRGADRRRRHEQAREPDLGNETSRRPAAACRCRSTAAKKLQTTRPHSEAVRQAIGRHAGEAAEDDGERDPPGSPSQLRRPRRRPPAPPACSGRRRHDGERPTTAAGPVARNGREGQRGGRRMTVRAVSKAGNDSAGRSWGKSTLLDWGRNSMVLSAGCSSPVSCTQPSNPGAARSGSSIRRRPGYPWRRTTGPIRRAAGPDRPRFWSTAAAPHAQVPRTGPVPAGCCSLPGARVSTCSWRTTGRRSSGRKKRAAAAHRGPSSCTATSPLPLSTTRLITKRPARHERQGQPGRRLVYGAGLPRHVLPNVPAY